MKAVAVLTLCILGFFTGTSAVAENISTTKNTLSVTGKVVSSKNKPQSGIPVEIQGPSGKIYTYTDQTGRWSMYNLPAGQYAAKPLGRKFVKDKSVDFTIKEKPFWSFGSKVQSVIAPRITAK